MKTPAGCKECIDEEKRSKRRLKRKIFVSNEKYVGISLSAFQMQG
jgi:hypothetical protein